MKNPFSPIFGGRPDTFFGRERILRSFDAAMADKGSGDRALFVTGMRGSGKTALLEQLSKRAEGRYDVYDLGPDDAVRRFVRRLAHHDEVTRVISPQVGINLMGMGGSLSAGSVARTRHYESADLEEILLTACGQAERGILVTIDEAQKLPLDDVSAICNAFQMASRKGHDVMLVVAGLPYAYGRVIHHEGCTFLRRGLHEELGLFSWEETDKALQQVFSSIGGLSVSSNQRDLLNERSYGHPYLMQLLGYFLVARAGERMREPYYEVSNDDVEAIVPQAVAAYEQRALRPMVEEFSVGDVEFLRAMSESLDDDRLAKSADIARKLGKEQRHLSQVRARLIDQGIIASPSFGRLMFCVPLLADYILETGGSDENLRIARMRRV